MRIEIKVKAHSKKQEVLKVGKRYIVSLKQKPEDNKANIELMKLLKKYFGKDIKIVRGLKNKNKIVEVK